MIFIIDAYNVLHYYNETIDEKTKDTFIQSIISYTKATRHTSIIVFDGGHSSSMPFVVQSHSKVSTVFTGPFITADAYIIALIKKQPKQEYVIVSFDREIVEAALRCNYAVFDPPVFLGIMRQHNQQKNNLEKTKKTALKKYESTSTTEEFDFYMQKYTQKNLPKKNTLVDESEQGEQCRKKPSKKEQKAIQIIKKAVRKK